MNRDLIHLCISSGLFHVDDEPSFSWRGCEHCIPATGATVYDCDGYTSIAEPQSGVAPHQFQICGDCLNTLYYGEKESLA